MPPFFHAYAFGEGPIENDDISGVRVVKEIAGVGIGVEDRIAIRGEDGNRDKGFDQPFRDPGALPARQAGSGGRDLLATFLAHRGDYRGAEFGDETGDADTDE